MIDADGGQSQCQLVMEITFGFSQSQCLFAAVEVGLFNLLHKGALQFQEIIKQAGISPRGGRSLLDALVVLGLMIRTNDEYSNSPAATRYLVESSPFYVGDLVKFVAARMYPVWAKLSDAINTGKPQNEALTELDYYANLTSDTIRLERFLKGMVGLSARPADLISRLFPWQKYKTFIDLGGASGAFAVHLLKAHDHLAGGVFELPGVRPFFERTSLELSDRLEFYEGNFFVDTLPSADVFILGNILHNWNSDEKTTLLSKVQRAVKSGGAIVVYEWFVDDSREKLLGLLDGLNMLLVTKTGCSVTEGECKLLLERAGFSEVATLVSDYPYGVIVGKKTRL